MVSAQREPIWKSEGRALSGSKGKAPGQGGGASPPEADDIFTLKEQFKQGKLHKFCIFYAANYATICAETMPIYNLDDSDDRASHLSIIIITSVKLRYFL